VILTYTYFLPKKKILDLLFYMAFVAKIELDNPILYKTKRRRGRVPHKLFFAPKNPIQFSRVFPSWLCALKKKTKKTKKKKDDDDAVFLLWRRCSVVCVVVVVV